MVSMTIQVVLIEEEVPCARHGEEIALFSAESPPLCKNPNTSISHLVAA
jgi:hypothetical protein